MVLRVRLLELRGSGFWLIHVDAPGICRCKKSQDRRHVPGRCCKLQQLRGCGFDRSGRDYGCWRGFTRCRCDRVDVATGADMGSLMPLYIVDNNVEVVDDVLRPLIFRIRR